MKESVNGNKSENRKAATEFNDKICMSGKVEKQDKNGQSLHFMSLLVIIKMLEKG